MLILPFIFVKIPEIFKSYFFLSLKKKKRDKETRLHRQVVKTVSSANSNVGIVTGYLPTSVTGIQLKAFF